MTSRPLPTSTPGAQGVAASGIAAFLDALEQHPAIEPHSLMLIRHGSVIAQGWWAPFTPAGLHHVYSVSKTFTITALGFAIAEGHLSLDDRVIGHFPEFSRDITTPRSRALRIRDLAAMASGHTQEMRAAAFETDPTEPVRGFLLHEPEEDPGSVFAYNQPCTYTIAAIIQRRTGQSLVEYLRPRLFDPLGIDRVAWQEYPAGRAIGFSGLHVPTDAIAKLGLLYLQDGRWQGAQLLPEGWAAEVRQLRVPTPQQDNIDWRQGYGFQVWQARHGYRGDGAFGQFCVILPEQDMVIATTAATYDMQAILDAAWEHLLPAVDAASTGESAAAASPEDVAIAARLERLALPALIGTGSPADADGWAGSFYLIGAEAAHLRTIAIVHSDDGAWRLELSDGSARTLSLPIAGSGWTAAGGVDGLPPVSATGGWTDAETLRVDISFVETPHRLALTVLRESRRAIARWLTEPLVDPSDGGIFALKAPDGLVST